MNRLRRERQVLALQCLADGASVRATERIVGAHRDTILRLMVRAADRGAAIMDRELRGLECRHLQLDEIWGYVGKHQRRMKAEDDPSRMGDFWTFLAVDTDTRLIPSYRVGKRDAETANAFLADVASRVTNKVLISSDMLAAYVDAIDRAFGNNVDYGQVVKSYEAEPIGPGRYSPPRVSSLQKFSRLGSPDMGQVSTTYVERTNLQLRMSIRRLTRLTDAFSKKLENFKAAVALHLFNFNYIRYHSAIKATPAMVAGVRSGFADWSELLEGNGNG